LLFVATNFDKQEATTAIQFMDKAKEDK